MSMISRRPTPLVRSGGIRTAGSCLRRQAQEHEQTHPTWNSSVAQTSSGTVSPPSSDGSWYCGVKAGARAAPSNMPCIEAPVPPSIITPPWPSPVHPAPSGLRASGHRRRQQRQGSAAPSWLGITGRWPPVIAIDGFFLIRTRLGKGFPDVRCLIDLIGTMQS
jgi:hypothetical protein